MRGKDIIRCCSALVLKRQEQEVLPCLALKSSCLLLAMSRPGLLGELQEAADSWLVLGSTFLQTHRGLRKAMPCSRCLSEERCDVQHLTECDQADGWQLQGHWLTATLTAAPMGPRSDVLDWRCM